MPMSPCGMAVDMLRSCYRTRMRVTKESTQLASVRWFFCAPDAKPLPFMTPFSSTNWSTEQCFDDGPGEQPGEPKIYDKGERNPAYTGQHYCGTEQDFQGGNEPSGPVLGWRNLYGCAFEGQATYDFVFGSQISTSGPIVAVAYQLFPDQESALLWWEQYRTPGCVDPSNWQAFGTWTQQVHKGDWVVSYTLAQDRNCFPQVPLPGPEPLCRRADGVPYCCLGLPCFTMGLMFGWEGYSTEPLYGVFGLMPEWSAVFEHATFFPGEMGIGAGWDAAFAGGGSFAGAVGISLGWSATIHSGASLAGAVGISLGWSATIQSGASLAGAVGISLGWDATFQYWTVLYCQSTNTDTTCNVTGVSNEDLATTVGSGTAGALISTTGYAQRVQWDILASGSSGDWRVSLNVTTLTGSSATFRFRIEFLNSSCAVVGSSAYSADFTTTGVKTLTDTAVTYPATTTRIRLSLEAKRAGALPGQVTVTCDSSSLVKRPP